MVGVGSMYFLGFKSGASNDRGNTIVIRGVIPSPNKT
jgi:hypothetical protein